MVTTAVIDARDVLSSAPWKRRGAVLYPNPTLPNPRLCGEPTLIQPEGNPIILTAYQTVWKMWYSQGGVLGIYYAESPDGIAWTTYAGPGAQGQVISQHQQPFVIKSGATYHMYCALNDGGASSEKQIDHYTSSDGAVWTLANSGVIVDGMGAWNVGQNTNSGGVIVGGTLYLFVEHGGIGIGLFTSTDFHTFTPVSLAINNGIVGSPTAPWQDSSGNWWLWIASGLISDAIQRWTAPALTGPWTNALSGNDFVQMTLDEGVNSGVGQVVDPFVMEYNGKTYLFYTGTHFISGTAYSEIKLAVADMPMSLLVKTAGGVDAGTLENPGMLGLTYDYTINGISTGNRPISLGSGILYCTEFAANISGTVRLDWGIAKANFWTFLGSVEVGNETNVGSALPSIFAIEDYQTSGTPGPSFVINGAAFGAYPGFGPSSFSDPTIWLGQSDTLKGAWNNATNKTHFGLPNGKLRLGAAGTVDVAIERNGVEILEINNGTTGALRDLTIRDVYTNDASFLVRTKTTLSNGAAASAATLTNAPAAGNPTKWISIDDNGTTRKIPAW